MMQEKQSLEWWMLYRGGRDYSELLNSMSVGRRDALLSGVVDSFPCGNVGLWN